VTTERDVARAVQQLPGWAHASWRPLHGGLTNDTFLLEADDRKAVLKVDPEPRSIPLNQREFEARIQRSAHAAKLAPQVLFANETIYLTEYIAGDVWTAAELLDQEKLDELARALKRVHALPLSGRTFNALEAAQVYLDELRRRGSGGADAEACIATIRALRSPANLCCCHNDLVAENIVATDSGLQFLDWEYACDNDPFFDLATVIAHHGLQEEQAHYLLDAYFDGNGAQWHAQLGRQEQLYAALAWLWQASRS
jgi:thiamine kinase